MKATPKTTPRFQYHVISKVPEFSRSDDAQPNQAPASEALEGERPSGLLSRDIDHVSIHHHNHTPTLPSSLKNQHLRRLSSLDGTSIILSPEEGSSISDFLIFDHSNSAIFMAGSQSEVSRPMSVQEISKKAGDFDFNDTIPLKYWLRTADTLLREVCGVA